MNFSVMRLHNLLQRSHTAHAAKAPSAIISGFCMVQDARRWPFQLPAQVIQGLRFFTKDAWATYPENFK